MEPGVRLALKIIEFISCVACVIFKIYTDQEARQTFYLNQKLSREWGLLHNITWSTAGNAFANVTYGGYTLITALMVISRCIDTRSHPTVFEKIILVVGVIMFFGMGGLVLAAIDQVPTNLIDNAIILGCMSFFVGLLFLIDLSDPVRVTDNEATQTDAEIRVNLTPVEIQAKETRQMQAVGVPSPLSIEERLMLDEVHKDVNVVESAILPTRQSPRLIKEPDTIRLPRQASNRYSMQAPANVHWQDYDAETAPNYAKRESKLVQDNRGFVEDRHQTHLAPQYMTAPAVDHAGQSSYMKAPAVDQAALQGREPCCSHKHSHLARPQQHQPRTVYKKQPLTPATPGYVAHTAKMWERRSRSQSPSSTSILGLQTNV